MKDAVLDLITSYENRISMVGEVVTTAYEAMLGSDDGLAELDKERTRLRNALQETLAKNCCLRRKDFNSLMERVLSDSHKGEKKEIEEERKQVREKLKEYLDKQKKLAASLRGQLVKFTQEDADRDSLGAIISDFKTACQDKGEQVFALLRNFQWHLESFQREQEEINRKLQRLVDRGESLKLDDLRQIEAGKARQDRKAERELRREDVERLLTHFRQQRQGNIHHYQ